MTAATTEKIIKHLCARDYFSKQIKIPPVKQCIDLIDWSFSDNDAKILFFVFVVQRKKSLHAVFILRDNINLQDVLWKFLFVIQDIRLILENTALCKRYSHEPLTCRMSAQGTDRFYYV